MKTTLSLIVCLLAIAGLSGCVVIGTDHDMGCTKCSGAHTKSDSEKCEMCKKCGHKISDHKADDKAAGEGKEHQH